MASIGEQAMADLFNVFLHNLVARLERIGYTVAVERDPTRLQYKAVVTHTHTGDTGEAWDWSPVAATEQAYARVHAQIQEHSP